MFESVNTIPINGNHNNFQRSLGRVNSFAAARLSAETVAEIPKESSMPSAGMPSQATPEELEKNLSGPHNVVVRFSFHEKTGKTIIKTVDKDKNEVIREIPSKEDLERSERLRMYIGRLFNAVA